MRYTERIHPKKTNHIKSKYVEKSYLRLSRYRKNAKTYLLGIAVCSVLSACVSTEDPDCEASGTCGDVDTTCDAFNHNLGRAGLYPGAISSDAQQRSIGYNSRSLGNLTLTILGNQSLTLTTSESVEANPSATQQAIDDLMQQHALFGQASTTEIVDSNTYNADQLSDLNGIDRTLLSELLGTNQATDATHYTVLNIVQPFYEVSATHTDADTDMINSIRYGRTLKLIARSTHAANEITAALIGAVSGGYPDVSVTSGYTHEAVLEMADVYLIDVYATDGKRWRRLDVSPQVLAFNEISTQLADPMLNTFSAQNPGNPIDYVIAKHAEEDQSLTADSVKTTLARCTPEPEPEPEPTRYYLEVENVKAGEVTVTINGTQCGTKSKTSRQYDIYRCLRENSPNDIRVSFNTDFGCRQTSISWYIHKNRDYNPIWPNRSSAQINSVKCDDFYWTSTLNTATDTFGNYRYVD